MRDAGEGWRKRVEGGVDRERGKREGGKREGGKERKGGWRGKVEETYPKRHTAPLPQHTFRLGPHPVPIEPVARLCCTSASNIINHESPLLSLERSYVDGTAAYVETWRERVDIPATKRSTLPSRRNPRSSAADCTNSIFVPCNNFASGGRAEMEARAWSIIFAEGSTPMICLKGVSSVVA